MHEGEIGIGMFVCSFRTIAMEKILKYKEHKIIIPHIISQQSAIIILHYKDKILIGCRFYCMVTMEVFLNAISY